MIELIITDCDTMQYKDIVQSYCAVTDIVICKGLTYQSYIPPNSIAEETAGRFFLPIVKREVGFSYHPNTEKRYGWSYLSNYGINESMQNKRKRIYSK